MLCREDMKVTIREGLIYSILVFYILYGFFGIGVPGLIFSLGIGLIVLSFDKSMEITIASILFSGIAWKMINEYYQRKKEAFEANVGSADSAGSAGSLYSVNEIIKRINPTKGVLTEPLGVLSSTYVEAFEDAPSSTENTASSTPSAPPAPATTTAPPAPTSTSSPAPTNAPSSTSQLQKDMPKTASSGFADKGTEGMFKLGSVPPDAIGGSHIDIGTTMMNALNALKPDQVKQMTDDTRKLLETQKSLMGMLGSMKPMLQDGKELMSTFNNMFGKGGVPNMPGI
jgi:hypothetical protein